jgi:hypothetical protein
MLLAACGEAAPAGARGGDEDRDGQADDADGSREPGREHVGGEDSNGDGADDVRSVSWGAGIHLFEGSGLSLRSGRLPPCHRLCLACSP